MPLEQPADVAVAPTGHTTSPIRIGILLVGTGKLNLVALKFLVLRLNTLQTAFEYEFVPVTAEHEFATRFTANATVDREQVRGGVAAFLKEQGAHLETQNSEMKLKEAPPERFVLVTLARFADNYISMRQGALGILALGNWKRVMAPPSILEFIITLIVRESVAFMSPSLRGSIHLGTKGCLCDFTMDLDEARFKMLQGFVCSFCRGVLETEGQGKLAEELVRVTDKAWLGSSSDPSTPAGIAASLGHNLFVTKGVEPTRWERFIAKIQEEGIKELIKIVGGVILASLLVWLGAKK